MRACQCLATAPPVAAADSIKQLRAVAQADRAAAEAAKMAAEAKKRLDPERLIDAIMSGKSPDSMCAAVAAAVRGVPDLQDQLVIGLAKRLNRNATDDTAPPPPAVHAALASSAARLAVEMGIKAARERVAAAAAAAAAAARPSSASAAQAEGAAAPAAASGIKSLLARPLRVLVSALGLGALATAPAAPATAPCVTPAPSAAPAPTALAPPSLDKLLAVDDMAALVPSATKESLAELARRGLLVARAKRRAPPPGAKAQRRSYDPVLVAQFLGQVDELLNDPAAGPSFRSKSGKSLHLGALYDTVFANTIHPPPFDTFKNWVVNRPPVAGPRKKRGRPTIIAEPLFSYLAAQVKMIASKTTDGGAKSVAGGFRSAADIRTFCAAEAKDACKALGIPFQDLSAVDENVFRRMAHSVNLHSVRPRSRTVVDGKMTAAARDALVRVAVVQHVLHVPPALVVNADETTIKLDGKTHKRVWAPRGAARVVDPTLDGAAGVSVIVGAAADGHLLPPFFVMPGSTAASLPSSTVLEELNARGGGVALAAGGWTTPEVVLEYVLATVKPFFERRMAALRAAGVVLQEDQSCILLMDNHYAHVNGPRFLEPLKKEAPWIVPLYTAAGSTAVTQPLDVGVMRALKARVGVLWGPAEAAYILSHVNGKRRKHKPEVKSTVVLTGGDDPETRALVVEAKKELRKAANCRDVAVLVISAALDSLDPKAALRGWIEGGWAVMFPIVCPAVAHLAPMTQALLEDGLNRLEELFEIKSSTATDEVLSVFSNSADVRSDELPADLLGTVEAGVVEEEGGEEGGGESVFVVPAVTAQMTRERRRAQRPLLTPIEVARQVIDEYALKKGRPSLPQIGDAIKGGTADLGEEVHYWAPSDGYEPPPAVAEAFSRILLGGTNVGGTQTLSHVVDQLRRRGVGRERVFSYNATDQLLRHAEAREAEARRAARSPKRGRPRKDAPPSPTKRSSKEFAHWCRGYDGPNAAKVRAGALFEQLSKSDPARPSHAPDKWLWVAAAMLSIFDADRKLDSARLWPNGPQLDEYREAYAASLLPATAAGGRRRTLSFTEGQGEEGEEERGAAAAARKRRRTAGATTTRS
jgi:hypothetical protein